MRSLVLMAFCALQLSVFTCGFDIHDHTMDSDTGHVAEHLHDDNHSHEQAADHACHVHTSHTFTAFYADDVGFMPLQVNATFGALAVPKLKNLAYLIEYPPKNQQS